MNFSLTKEITELLEWAKVLNALAERITSEPGKSFALSITPISEEDARNRLTRISECRAALIENRWCDFSALHDISKAALRASKGSTLSAKELFTARGTLKAFSVIRSFFMSNSETMPLCGSDASTIDPCHELSTLLTRAFREDGEINGSTYPQIGRIERAIIDTKSSIEKTLSKIVHSSQMEDALQEKIHTIRNDRYVVLVKTNMRGRLKGTVHDISSSSSTLFVEPEAIQSLNDELLMRRAELERETEKILAELSESVGFHSDAISQNTVVSSYLDFIQGAAKFSRDIKGAAPLISNDPVIELFSARHPLLQLLINEKNIANDITLGKNYLSMVITGANTGGKTVLLKTIGLSSLLASHGLHIAASPDSRIGLFTSIMADIGDDQSIEKSLSTFSGQVVALNTMLESCDDRSLILLDEIMAGTNPRHGAALAQAILESFSEKGAKVAVTTHYPELRNLAPHDSRFKNASVSFNVETLKPTYELITGIPGASFTFEIASKYGMSESIIKRATEITSGDELSTEALIEKINQYKEEISSEKTEIEKLRSELAEEKQKYESMQKLLKDETRKVKKGEGLAILDELRSYREKAAEKIKSLQNAGIKQASAIQREIGEIEKTVAGFVSDISAETFAETHKTADESKIEPGTHVLVIPLEKEGTVEECNDEKKIAVVRLGNIFSRYSYNELLIPDTEPDKKSKKQVQYKSVTRSENTQVPVTVQTEYNTIDLRGMRVDVALIKLDERLDSMLRVNISTAVIIHGHGTGAMKEAVRKQLKISPYVRSFRAGEQSEGGDGVSVVLIG